ncbi:MAG TPA: DUF4375 domain-containing protein [Pirellulales bacterium]|nr:DUF4375 domain-containing protein [Pirellulales bacterium]
MIRRQVRAQLIDEQPHVLWNEFIHILAMSPTEQLTMVQRVAQDAFWYESEIQNGGHLQYFENQGANRVEDVVSALRKMGARGQAAILTQAFARYKEEEPRHKIRTVEDFCDVSLDQAYFDLDQAFAACTPGMTALLQQYLINHEAEFIERI